MASVPGEAAGRNQDSGVRVGIVDETHLTQSKMRG